MWDFQFWYGDASRLFWREGKKYLFFFFFLLVSFGWLPVNSHLIENWWMKVDQVASSRSLEFGSDACIKISSVYNHLLITWINGRIRWENMINASYGGWTCLDCIWFLHLLKLCSKALFRKGAHCSERQGLLQVHASIMKDTALQAATPCKLELTNPLTGKEKVTVFK